MATLAQKSRPGRPTREQSEQRHRELLDRAMEMFLERGFEHATIRDIAADVGMTRRTVYARYPDKRALFTAIVEHAVNQVMLPAEALHALDGKGLEETLIGVARMRIANVMTPVGLRLQRILHTESYQFPEVVNAAYTRITRPAIDFIADLLRRNNAAGVTDVEEPERAASALMNMVVGVPVRMVLLGNFLGPEEIEDRIRFSVGLFMKGVCRR